MGLPHHVAIGSDYDWRCYACGAVSTTERRGSVVDLPRGWVCHADGRVSCAACLRARGASAAGAATKGR